MHNTRYPDFITALPEAQIAFDGVRGWLSQADNHQVVFMDIEPIGTVPTHSHGEQWGVVVEGAMELTIGGKTKLYHPGDSYHIPTGVPHSGNFLARTRVIDVFAEPDRYKAVEPGGDQRE